MQTRAVDVAKCVQLIQAAGGGHLDLVKLLVACADVDVNFVWQVGGDPTFGKHFDSALSMALERKHTDVAIFLLQQGAQCDAPKGGLFTQFGGYKTALAIACRHAKQDENIDAALSLMKLILRASNDIRTGYGLLSIGQLLADVPLGSYLYANLYLHEAVLRCDTAAIGIVREKVSTTMTLASFKQYLEGRQLTRDEASKAIQGLDHLDKKGAIDSQTCAEIKGLLRDSFMPAATVKSISDDSGLRERNRELQDQIEQLKQQCEKLKRENQELQSQMAKLKDQNGELKDQNIKLKEAQPAPSSFFSPSKGR
jgi:hypothetical protein